jgi:hypothetical protein
MACWSSRRVDWIAACPPAASSAREMPAQQGLEAGQPTRSEVVTRLAEEAELIEGQGGPQIGF